MKNNESENRLLAASIFPNQRAVDLLAYECKFFSVSSFIYQSFFDGCSCFPKTI